MNKKIIAAGAIAPFAPAAIFRKTLVIQTVAGKNLPMGNSATFQWDLMEFVVDFGDR